jgi:MoxR-like ATPase
MIDDIIEGFVGITEELAVYGWSHLDAVVLASLATEAPVLLVGTHGTAKTLLVERLSQVLDLQLRHYNASFINYDDLVGIPMPDETNENLRFITSKQGAIWEAEFVFFDEISRCRPDMQNKLFPILHERKVLGMPLSNLQHRWAAMNPPIPNDPSAEVDPNEYYIGSEMLDIALIDRFPFILSAPPWRELSRRDQMRIITEHFEGTDMNLMAMVVDCAELIPRVEREFSEWLGDYMVCLMGLLEKAHLPQSPRRARMIARSILSIHAARLVLEGDDIEDEDSAELAVVYGMPQSATDTPPSVSTLVAAHKQAWEIVNRLDDGNWRRVLQETDHIKRVILADDLGFSDEDLSKLITQALNVDALEVRKVSLATAMFLAFQEHRTLTPATWEPLAKLAGRILLPRVADYTVNNNSAELTVWNEILPFVTSKRELNTVYGELEANFVLGCFPDFWRTVNWRETVAQFVADLKLFGIEDGTHE